MDTEKEKWVYQLQSLLFKPNAILKVVTAAIGWQLLGLLLGLLFNIGISVIFVAVFFGVLWLAPYWQPAYWVIYQIIGDKTVSPTLEINHSKLRWWQYISLSIKLAFLAYILYIGLKLFFK
jgi:hypothetical protein